MIRFAWPLVVLSFGLLYHTVGYSQVLVPIPDYDPYAIVTPLQNYAPTDGTENGYDLDPWTSAETMGNLGPYNDGL